MRARKPKPKTVSEIAAERAMSNHLNWQIAQQERFIRENCSFFCFVGPWYAFPPAPQVNRSLPVISIGGIQIGKPEPAYVTGKDYARLEVAA